MNHLRHISRNIGQSVMPTTKAYIPLLMANADAIRSTRRETFSYGAHDRQSLDVYYPSKQSRSSVSSANTPVAIFVHGGGLVNGSKQLPMADGLIFANIGHFFAEKFGYTVVIPDYRLMSHGAKYPSGGEDVAAVVDWVRESLSQQEGHKNIDLLLIGNSAGGIHNSTYLFAPDFAASRNKVATTNDNAPVKLKGAVMLSVPLNFRQADPTRSDVLDEYYGKEQDKLSPQGLLETALKKDADSF